MGEPPYTIILAVSCKPEIEKDLGQFMESIH
jgi:hypothetical protein